MQAILRPVFSSAGGHHHLLFAAAASRPPRLPAEVSASRRCNLSFSSTINAFSSFPSLRLLHCPSPSFERRGRVVAEATPPVSVSAGCESAQLAQVSKRLQDTARYFKRLGDLGFWGQLVCTVIAAVILSFSAITTGKITSPATFYATAGGIAAAFVSVFWSFGYIRLSERLRRTANEPAKAPSRSEVVKSLKNGILLNILGMGATILGMQATIGLLVAKALTSSAVPYYQGLPPGQNPVLALDVFLVQASANTILSHFLGLVFSLELLRSVTLPQAEGNLIPRPA